MALGPVRPEIVRESKGHEVPSGADLVDESKRLACGEDLERVLLPRRRGALQELLDLDVTQSVALEALPSMKEQRHLFHGSARRSSAVSLEADRHDDALPQGDAILTVTVNIAEP